MVGDLLQLPKYVLYCIHNNIMPDFIFIMVWYFPATNQFSSKIALKLLYPYTSFVVPYDSELPEAGWESVHHLPQKRGTARDGSSTVRDGASAVAMDQEHNGDGRRWTARWRIDGDGRRGATAMDGATATRR